MKRISKLSQLWKPFLRKNISIYAAGASFYLLLSALPASALLLSVVPYLPVPEEFWTSMFEHVVPSAFLPVIYALWEKIYLNKSLTALSLSALTTLWSASKGTLFIMNGLNAALEFPVPRGYFRRRILAILYFLFLTISFLIILIGIVFGRLILRLLIHSRYVYFSISGSFMLLLILFTLIYFLLPTKKLPLKSCLWSGLFVSLGWLLFSVLFSIYVNLFSEYTELYGIIGLLILAAIWLRFCISVVLYGGIFAKLKADNCYHPWEIIKQALSSQ